MPVEMGLGDNLNSPFSTGYEFDSELVYKRSNSRLIRVFKFAIWW
jgi:hypothetical protein